MYPSPGIDYGYDISDYTAIDPEYGTMADFDHMVAEAKKRNIRVIMDYVINHTSDQHQWFLESRSSRTNPKRDWYVWHDGKGETATDKGHRRITGSPGLATPPGNRTKNPSVVLPLLLQAATRSQLAQPRGPAAMDRRTPTSG